MESDFPDDVAVEVSFPFTQEVRNLFGVSVVTDLVVNSHTEDCYEQSYEEERSHCDCVPNRYYYLGRRAIPQEGAHRA